MAPNFPANQREFVRALVEQGAQVTGIGDVSPHALDDQMRSWLSGYEYVRSQVDEEAVFQAVRRIQERGPWVDRFETTIEATMLTVARVRERTAIPGLSYRSVLLCRDKFLMKQELRKNGIPCARNAEVFSGKEAAAFVEEVGFPVILKPRDGAGAHATYKIEGKEDLLRALAETGLDRGDGHFTIEEFISGHEGFYDTLTCGSEIAFESVSHYYPNVLEAMRTRWISPQIVTTNRIQASGYEELKAFGRKVISILDLTTTATHMEWFYGPKGLTFSEIGARPPGCRFWDLYNFANDFDLYNEWAKALLFGKCNPRPSRRYSGGLISLRPSEDGYITGYAGREEIYRLYGQEIVHGHFPHPGTKTSPVGAGYLAHAWLWVRHPDYDQCRAILSDIGQTCKMLARS